MVIEAVMPSTIRRTVESCYDLSSYCANHEFANSRTYQLGSFDLPNGAIGFTNGINNNEKQFLKSAVQLNEYAQGAKI